MYSILYVMLHSRLKKGTLALLELLKPIVRKLARFQSLHEYISYHPSDGVVERACTTHLRSRGRG